MARLMPKLPEPPRFSRLKLVCGSLGTDSGLGRLGGVAEIGTRSVRNRLAQRSASPREGALLVGSAVARVDRHGRRNLRVLEPEGSGLSPHDEGRPDGRPSRSRSACSQGSCKSYALVGRDSGGGIRTRDLRVMSPTSYQTAPPRVALHVLAKSTVIIEARRRSADGRRSTRPTVARSSSIRACPSP